VRVSLRLALIAAVALVWVPAASAHADATNSVNWAGYAVHRSGVSFRKVVAAWRQPNASCRPGVETFSSYWVGLGGFSLTSNALEQVGTELDCGPTGRVYSSAWYELVPAASITVRLTVQPGDLMKGTVVANGHHVVLDLYDTTLHTRFHKALYAPSVDVSSADWIVEAPSDCVSANLCQTLPLADFGSAAFTGAHAQTTRGHFGSVNDGAWNRTKILLTPSGRRFVVNGRSVAGAATPSPLQQGGTAFSVSYSATAAGAAPDLVRQIALRSGYIVH
jgi:hypothetical protein